MKNNIIYLFLIITTIMSCTTPLNRYKLDKQNQIYWDYYHSVDYCRRIELFEFITKDQKMESWLENKQTVIEYLHKGKVVNDCKHGACYFTYTKENMYDYKKNSKYYEFKSLYDYKNNSFYGYIYHDIKNKSKDKIDLSRGLPINGRIYYTKYLESERPPMSFTYKEFEDALLRWRKACGCDTTKNN